MPSWRSIVVVAIIVTGCRTSLSAGGDDEPAPVPEPDDCETSFLDYQNFGAPFIANWCRGCHASGVPETMRQDAPLDVNFDDHGTTMQWKTEILRRATGDAPTMPPAGGPSDEERALLAEWLACGGT